MYWHKVYVGNRVAIMRGGEVILDALCSPWQDFRFTQTVDWYNDVLQRAQWIAPALMAA